MKRPFSSLSPQEALHVAIFIEERNADLYHRFAEMFSEFRDDESTEIAGVFWEMAAEERNHSALLQSRYTEKYANAGCELTEEDILEFIEVPRLEEGDVFSPVRDGYKVAGRNRALNVALSAEKKALQYYRDLSAQTEPGPLKQLYLELARFEDGHVAYLEGKLATPFAEHKAG